MQINGHPLFIAQTTPSNFLKEWREHQDSLTDKLKAIQGTTELELISQCWQTPSWWDRYCLDVTDDLIFKREILMKHNRIDCWYARTIIPQKCYNAHSDFFNRLEKESMRNLIFDNSTVHRVNMINYPINHQNIEFYWIKKQLQSVPDLLWVRLAEYSLQQGLSFFLAELLLPGLESVSRV